MALDAELQKALNEQMTLEFSSSYQYLAFAGWLEEHSYPGMAHWMQAQSEEERSHGMRFYQFVLDREGTVELGSIAPPDASFSDPLAVFEAALAAEKRVTAAIHALYAKVTDHRDFASYPLLDWFVNEQVEEEATVTQIVDDLRRAGDEGNALFMIDRELGSRGGGDDDD